MKDDIYLEMPRGYREKGKVLKLKKNVYGLRQAPLNFFLKLKQGLEDCHFVQSENDPCLFYSEKVICLVYVDDCLFFARDDEDIDKIIDSLKDGFLLEKETSFAGYLGIHIDRSTEGELHLLQSDLIERILKVMNLEDCHPNAILAQKKV